MRQLLMILVIIFGNSTYGQVYTENIIPTPSQGKDAFVYSSNPSYNYHNQIYHHAYGTSSGSAIRTYTQFDLSSIPDNAVINSANLQLHIHSNYGAADVKFTMVNESWDESGANGVNWNNQPTILWGAYALSFSGQTTSYHNYNVTDHVNRWVNLGYENNGWQIRLVNETTPTSNEGYAYSSTDRGAPYTPKLTVEYYLPITASVVINHCTSGNSDGGVSVFDIEDGSGNYTINWYNSSNYSIGSGATIAGLSAGYYVLKIKDNVNEQLSCTKVVLIGEEGSVTNVTVNLNDNLMQHMYVREDHPYNNWSVNNWSLYNGLLNSKEFASHFKYDLGDISNINISAATMVLREDNNNYMWNFGAEDKAYLYRKKFHWYEGLATWHQVDRDNIDPAMTTIQGVENTNKIWDFNVLSDVLDYQINPSNMFQYEIGLEDVTPYSPNSTHLFGFYTAYHNVGSYRPKLKITFGVNEPIEITGNVDSDTGSGTGTITSSASGGDGQYTYEWYNSQSTLLGETTNILSSLSDGFYSLKVTDGLGTSNSQLFLVTDACKGKRYDLVMTEINTNDTYLDDRYMNTVNLNTPFYGNGVEQYFIPNNTIYPRITSFVDLSVIGLENSIIENVKYKVKNFEYVVANSSNVRLKRVNSEWYEQYLNAGSFYLLGLPVLSSNSLHTREFSSVESGYDCFDLTIDFNEFKTNMASFYGYKFDEYYGSSQISPVYYKTYGSGSITNQPILSITVQKECVFTHLRKQLDQSYYIVDMTIGDGLLKFIYHEEYADQDNVLNYEIYDQNNNLVNGFDPLEVKYGYNEYLLDVSFLIIGEFYILKVENEKGEVIKLRFKLI